MATKLKNMGQFPPDLLARIDAKAWELGQTRVKFVTRALGAALGDDVPAHPEDAPLPRFRSAPRSSSLQNFMPKAP